MKQVITEPPSSPDKSWKVMAPYTLTGKLGAKTYTTATTAADGCMKTKGCVGFTRTAANKFILNKSVSTCFTYTI